ncbi:MAG: type II toxin-antitoxin system RatA family toxin [Gammaproteobacteria bacterium]|nr:type II toxin-antitoxin system RatA family toxin [Gammaproteobacteria bacterium]
MPAHATRRTLPWSCEQLFDLAADVERYPEFIPGWQNVRVLERSNNRLTVEQCLGLGPLQHCFTSSAVLERPSRLTVSSSDEPFRELHIEWLFEAAGNHCITTLTVSLEIDNPLLENAAETLFILGSDDIIARFEQRAREVFGVNHDNSRE